MRAEIDSLYGFCDATQRGLSDRLGRSGKGNHGTVVIRIAFGAQELNARDGGNRFGDRSYCFPISSFTKIRDTLDQAAFHSISGSRYTTRPSLMVISTRLTPNRCGSSR